MAGRSALLASTALVWLGMPIAQAQMFTDMSTTAGFEPAMLANIPAGGIAVDDFDRNGWPDIFVTGYLQPNRLFYNQGDGSFVERPEITTAIAGNQCSVTAAADFDNDGWPDLYVGCRQQSNLLLRNLNGTGFANVTPAALDHNPPGPNPARTDAVAWGDLDGNGLLDLYVGVYPNSAMPQAGDPDNYDRILLQQANGQWQDAALGLSSDDRLKLMRTALAVAFTDLNGDGRSDIYVVNDKLQGNLLFRNDGPGCGGVCLTDIATASGTVDPAFGMGIAIGDVDRDLDWDLYYSSIDEQFFLRCQVASPPSFLRESGSPLNYFAVGWGTIFSDFDNDGWEDAFLAVGSGGFSTTPNFDQVFMNQGNGQFQLVGTDSGVHLNVPTQAAARIDVDADGRTDLVLGHWNIGYRLFRNQMTSSGHWLALRLQGGGSVNRDGIGAVVSVTLDDGATLIRELRAGESRGASHEKVLHFGLGERTPTAVQVRWPDGSQQALGPLLPDRYHSIAHPAAVLFANGFEN